MREKYYGGGEYYCSKCKFAHHFLGKIGRKHIGYASVAMQKFSFVNYGIYKK